jgi:hypothetical protein
VQALTGGLLLTHLVAYTLEHPFESYGWYCVPSLFCLATLAAMGTSSAAARLASWSKRNPGRVALPTNGWVVTLLLLVLMVGARSELRTTGAFKTFSALHERDRAEAGRWVEANTPEGTVVLTLWGNPAFHAHRPTIDASFLNRPWEDGDLVARYRPEVLILQGNPGSSPMSPVFAHTDGTGYTLVRLFDRTYSQGMDYYFAVLARNDVLPMLTGVETPRDLFRFIDAIEVGDELGRLTAHDHATLFVHPGVTRATAFRFQAAALAAETGLATVNLRARIARIPEDAEARGAGVVGLQVRCAENQVVDTVVSPGRPADLTFEVASCEVLHVAVDSNGSPDTDWLLISLQ